MRAFSLAFAVSFLVSLPVSAQDAASAPPEGAPPPAAPAAAAAPAAMAAGGFGQPGQFAVSVDLPFTNSAPQFAIVHESQSMGGPSSTTFAIAPSLDYFVAPSFSVGGILGVAKGTQNQSGLSIDVTAFTVAGRVGYNVPIIDMLSLWPRAAIGYTHGSGDTMGVSVTLSSVTLVVEAPLLYHPVPHFFLGAGPMLSTELTNSISANGMSMDQPKTTDIGIEAMVGGYFGGT